MIHPTGPNTTLDLDPASGLPQLPAVLHDVRVLLETLGYLGVVLVDLSEFDGIESEFGRQAYNGLLRDFANDFLEVAHSVTRSDDFLAVLHPYGEEFVLFLEGPRGETLSPRTLDDVVERIWLAMQPRLTQRIESFGVSGRARLGYALALSNVSLQSERLIYRSIEEARSMAGLHGRRVINRAREQVRDLLVNSRISIEFQPVVDIDGARVYGYEALARGPRDSSIHAPMALFSLAKSANLISELWMSCLDLAIAGASNCPPDASIFINITPSLLHDGYVDACLARAEASGVAPERFVLELSEQVAVRNYELLHRKLQTLRGRGVRIAIDDLGTGYSNLNQIMRLDPDFLKVDMELVRDVHLDGTRQELIASLIRISSSMKSTVIAEGIETAEERDTLRGLEVKMAQGFFYAVPAAGFWEPG